MFLCSGAMLDGGVLLWFSCVLRLENRKNRLAFACTDSFSYSGYPDVPLRPRIVEETTHQNLNPDGSAFFWSVNAFPVLTHNISMKYFIGFQTLMGQINFGG